MAEDQFSKTEQPTAKKLEDAKQRSGAPTSRDLSTTLTIIAGAAILYATGHFTFSKLSGSTRDAFISLSTFRISEENCAAFLNRTIYDTLSVLLPILLLIAASSIVVNLVQQGGILISTDKISFKPDRLNPLNGLGRLFKKEQAVEVVKAFLRIGIVGFIAYKVISGELETISRLPYADIDSISAYLTTLTLRVIANVCGVLLVLSVLDLFYVKWKFIHDNKMTKQEVKDEMKKSDGDPAIKNKIKSLQFQAARRQLDKVVPLADVIIVNPTHYAVALKFDREKMPAPMVIAKGVDALALRIKEIARDNKIIIVENKPLARELHKKTKEGEIIPEDLYGAVAEVLAYVYSIKGFPQD